MATNDGTLSHPSYLLLDAAELAAQTTDFGADVACAGFAVAIIEAVTDKQWSLFVCGTGDPAFTVDGATDPPDLYDGLMQLTKADIAANTDIALSVDIWGLRWLRVIVYNQDASNAAAATLRVTLR